MRSEAFIKSVRQYGLELSTDELCDVGHYEERKVPGIIPVSSIDDLAFIMKTARMCGIRLHPYSAGKNWGFGSRKPVKSNTFLLDLRGLNKIEELDIKNGQAVIQAGVTQEMLADALTATTWMVNVTSAGGTSSIVGNAVENGVGMYGRRREDILELKALMPKGEVLIINHVHAQQKSERGALSIDKFLDITPGIIVGARIRLLPRPESTVLCYTAVSRENLPEVIFQCAELQAQGLIQGKTKVYNREQRMFLVVAALTGSTTLVRENMKAIQKVSAIQWQFYTDNADTIDEPALQSLLELYRGVPTNRALKRYLMKPGHGFDLDENSYLGLRLFAVKIPMDKDIIRWAEELLSTPNDQLSVDFTWNIWDAESIGLVIYFHFARNDKGVQAARLFHDDLYTKFSARGVFPYRYDVDHAGEKGRKANAGGKQLAAMRRRLDPDDLISPGKFC